MKVALILSVTLLSLAIIIFTFLTIILRFWRINRSKRYALHRAKVRKLIVELTIGEEEPSDQNFTRKLKLGQLEELSESIATKVKGESKDRLVSFLESKGSVTKAIRRTRRLGSIGKCNAASFLGNLSIVRGRPALEALLGSRNREVRISAARALGQIGLPESIPALLDSLDRPGKQLPFGTCIVALLDIGPKGEEYILAGLEGAGERQRAACSEMLGIINSIKSTQALIDHFQNDSSIDVRIRCARALGRIGSPRAVSQLIKGLEDDNPLPLRLVSCRSLGQLGDPEAVPAIANLLTSDNHQLLNTAVQTLSQLSSEGFKSLTSLAVSHSPNRDYALEALARKSVKSAVIEPQLEPLEVLFDYQWDKFWQTYFEF